MWCDCNDNADAIDKRLVIFGDSFMDFQESTTTIVFAEQFRETHFVWSSRIDYGYAARVEADIVMTETAELIKDSGTQSTTTTWIAMWCSAWPAIQSERPHSVPEVLHALPLLSPVPS